MTIGTGTKLGPYEIVSPLGAGGMGEVYLAEDTRLGRKVALKVLSAELTRNEDRVRRFEQEARAASALSHPLRDDPRYADLLRRMGLRR
jgi:serine/threonine protein kinase